MESLLKKFKKDYDDMDWDTLKEYFEYERECEVMDNVLDNYLKMIELLEENK